MLALRCRALLGIAWLSWRCLEMLCYATRCFAGVALPFVPLDDDAPRCDSGFALRCLAVLCHAFLALLYCARL
jgi:hypothetical protein